MKKYTKANIDLTSYLPISVVIPCFNCASTIEFAVKSVLTQTQLPKEIFLIDDFSTDQNLTKIKIEKLVSENNTSIEINAHYLSHNSGPATTRNKGWDLATGKYVAFLDSDDYWHPDKLATQWVYISKYNKLDILGCNIKSKKLNTSSFIVITPFVLLKKNPYFTSSVIVRKDLQFRFPENSYYSEDFFLWSMIINHKGTLALLMNYKVASNQNKKKGLSSNNFKMLKGELKVLLYTCRESFNYPIFFIASSWSVLKFFKRLFFN